MVENFQQIIWCCARENRAFLREVAVAPNNVRVTSIEKLPPYYEIPLEKLRDPEENILKTTYKIEGYEGCPFCGNRGLFYCDECGKISCTTGGKTHYCPGCRKTHGSIDYRFHHLSKSGLLGPAPEKIAVNRGADTPAPTAQTLHRRRDYFVGGAGNTAPPVPENTGKAAMRENVRKFLEEKKKFQIEDKRDKKQ